MVGSSRRGSAGRGRFRGRGKRGRITEDEDVEDMSPHSHPSSARQFTPKIVRTPDDFETFTSPPPTHGSTLIRRVIENESVYTRREQLPQTSEKHLSRTPDDLVTFTSPCTHGSTLIRRVIENESVCTRREQLTQTSERHLSHTPDDLVTFTSPCTNGSTLIRRVIENESVYTQREQLTPILGTTECEDQDHSHSRLEMGSSDSTSQGAEEQKYVETPLYLKSDSHKSNSSEKENAMDDVFEGALVAGGTEHNTSLQLENSNSGMEVPAVNLPTIFSLPWSATQKNTSNSQEESHQGYPSPTDVHENVGSSSTNNGSREMAIEKSKTLPAPSLNTTQIFEELGFGTNFEVESMGPGNDLVSLKGYKYKVKAQYVSLLTSILSKYGNIGANCSMESVTFLSICMEHVCDIVQTLKNTNLKVMTKNKLESLMAAITDLEEERVDVGWLRKRLDEISEAEKVILELAGASSNLKKRHGEQLSKVEAIKEQLEEYKRAMVDLQKKVNLAESDLSVAMAEVSQTEYSISEKKAKLKHVYNLESLAHGLL